MDLEGWYPDPFGIHEERLFKDGEPTPLVRDNGVGSYDQPPDPEALVSSRPDMPKPPPLPPADWYPDSSTSGQERFWNGSGWTEHFRAVPPPLPGVVPVSPSTQLPSLATETRPMGSAATHADNPTKLPLYKRWWLWATTGLIIVVVVIALLAEAGRTPHPSTRARAVIATTSTVQTTTTLPPTTTSTLPPTTITTALSVATWVSDFRDVFLPTMDADLQQVGSGLTVAETGDTTLLASSCTKFGADVSTALAYPPIPDPDDQSHWSLFLTDLQGASASCTTDLVNGGLQNATQQMNTLEILLGSTG